MLWIRFDESDHWNPAPSFCLPGISEKQPWAQICLQDYHEDCNLALFFAHRGDCPDCIQALHAFAGRHDDYNYQEAKILAVFPEPLERLAGDPALAGLPFPLLADPQGSTRRAYEALMAPGLVQEEAPLLFVLDRYNAPYAALAGNGAGQDAGIFQRDDIQDDILKWFEFIGIQCPE